MNQNKEHKFESNDFLELLKKLEQTKPSDLNNTLNKENLDDFDKEAMEGALFYSDSNSFTETQNYIESEINQKINETPAGKRKGFIWFSAAASLALVIGISIFLFNKERQDTLSISLLEEQSNAVSKDKMTINEPNKDEVLKRTELEEEIQKNTNSVETSEKKIVSQNQNRQLESISTNLNSPDEDNRKPEGLAENKSDEPISLTEKTLDDNSTVAAGAMSTNSKLEAEADMIVYAETESVSKNTKKSKAAKEESKTYSNTGTMPAAEGQSDKVGNQNIKTNIIPFSETMYDGGMNQLVSDLKKQIAKESIESVPETIILKGKINNKNTFIINSFECLPSSKNYNSKSLTNIIGKLPGWNYLSPFDNQIIQFEVYLKE